MAGTSAQLRTISPTGLAASVSGDHPGSAIHSLDSPRSGMVKAPKGPSEDALGAARTAAAVAPTSGPATASARIPISSRSMRSTRRVATGSASSRPGWSPPLSIDVWRPGAGSSLQRGE